MKAKAEKTLVTKISSMKTNLTKYARSKQSDKDTIYELTVQLQSLRDELLQARKQGLNTQRDFKLGLLLVKKEIKTKRLRVERGFESL